MNAYNKDMEKYYIGKNVVLSGDITLGNNVSIWHNSVLRADTAPITIAQNTNIQDLCMLHAGDNCPISIGQNVTVGHRALLHGCTIEDNCLIGMGAIVMNRAVIPHHSIVAAGSLISENKTFPPYSLLLGSPAKVVRQLTEEEIQHIEENSVHYIQESEQQLQQVEL